MSLGSSSPRMTQNDAIVYCAHANTSAESRPYAKILQHMNKRQLSLKTHDKYSTQVGQIIKVGKRRKKTFHCFIVIFVLFTVIFEKFKD